MKMATMTGGNTTATHPNRRANARTFSVRVGCRLTRAAAFIASHSRIIRAVASCRLSWLSMYRRGSAPISIELSKSLVCVHSVAFHEPAPPVALNAVQVSPVHVHAAGPIGGNSERLTAKAGHDHGLAQGEPHGVRAESVKFVRSERSQASGGSLGFSALGSVRSAAGSVRLVHETRACAHRFHGCARWDAPAGPRTPRHGPRVPLGYPCP